MALIDEFNDLYDELAASGAFGDAQHTITFSQTEAGTFDPVTGGRTGGTSTDYTAKGWFTGFKYGRFPDWQAGDATFIIKQSDLKDENGVLYTPAIDDRPVIGGKTYKVVYFTDDKAGGVAGGGVTYKIQLRGG